MKEKSANAGVKNSQKSKIMIIYSGIFLKWTRKELRQMDQRIKKLMNIHKDLHSTDDIIFYFFIFEDDQKAPFSIGVGESATPFPELLHFTLDMYRILLSVKQGGIKYHF